ncbi:MAG: aldehyde dehydrogenase family protein [Alistipes putredinis]|nr:MAG: aldehyde dehydrogenase family protein [Alistipes putredinis]
MIKDTVQSQRDFFRSGATLPLEFRLQALKKLRGAIVSNRASIEEALRVDLSKSGFESYTTEIGIMLGEIDYHISHLKGWMRPRRVKTPLFLMPAASRVMYQPLGVVLVIAPWNYPVQLSLNPLIGAVAAGNCAVVKPSPSAPASARVIEKIVNEAFPQHYVCVLQGGAEIMDELLEQRFDHIFYTGGTEFGKNGYAVCGRQSDPRNSRTRRQEPVYSGQGRKYRNRGTQNRVGQVP